VERWQLFASQEGSTPQIIRKQMGWHLIP
jgi:hypothetical protein